MRAELIRMRAELERMELLRRRLIQYVTECSRQMQLELEEGLITRETTLELLLALRDMRA